jgi:hypothetical protein
MATLDAQTAVDDDDDAKSAASVAPKDLQWHWRTWPNNLRKAVGIGLSVLVLIIILILFLQETDKDFTQKLDTDTGIKAQAINKLRDSGKERDTIVKQLPTLRELEELGIFGEEKRLEWVEHLRTIEKRWPGISIKYDIAPQKILPREGNSPALPPIPPGAKLPNGDPVKQFGVFSTDMKLTLQLLHEGDTLAILDELKAANLGLFSVKKCTLRRAGSSSDIDIPGDLGIPVFAECLLNWISMTAYTP